MEQEPNANNVDLLSVAKEQLNESLEQLKKEAECYREILTNAFPELLKNSGVGDDSSKKNNFGQFLDFLFQYFTLNSRIEELKRNLSLSENIGQSKNGPTENIQEKDDDDTENENNNNNGDNYSIKRKNYYFYIILI